MILTNPSLVLTFLGDDLEKSHSTTQTIIDDGLVRHSFLFKYQLLNGLKSSSNQVSFQINKGNPSIEDIIRTEGDIKATLKDGVLVLFTGYLSNSYSWTLTSTGEQVFSVSIEDVGTRLLGKSFIQSGHHLFNCAAKNAIKAICDSAGVVVSNECIDIESKVVKTVDSGTSCKDILDQLLYELGYVRYFDNLGHLRIFKIDCESTAGIRVLTGSDFIVIGGKALGVSKKIHQYKSARVSFNALGTAEHYLVYRNTSGQGDGHPYCYQTLGPGEHFDGTNVYTDCEWTANTVDSFYEDALISACNAASETEKVGSAKIVAISNVQQSFTSDENHLICTITEAGGPYLKIHAHNSGNLPFHITRMDAYADIIYEKETAVVRTGTTAEDVESSDSLLKEDLLYVHDYSLAQNHANLLGQYHRFCNTQYSFALNEDLALGSIVHVFDDVFSSLESDVMLISKSTTDKNDIVQYTAIGISAFNLTERTFLRMELQGSNITKGQDGSSFTVQIQSSNGSIFRSGYISTILSCHVYMNLTEITSQMEDWRFSWKRNSGNTQSDLDWGASDKATGHKRVEIGSSDCSGRTVFDCEVDFSDLAI